MKKLSLHPFLLLLPPVPRAPSRLASLTKIAIETAEIKRISKGLTGVFLLCSKAAEDTCAGLRVAGVFRCRLDQRTWRIK
jgi:hypothetical protein